MLTDETSKRVMHKRELIDLVARKSGKMKRRDCGLTRRQVARALDLILDVIGEQMEAGNAVTIAGFGRFEAKLHAGRRVVGPDGQEYQVEPRLVPSFRPYPALRLEAQGRAPEPPDEPSELAFWERWT